MHRWKCSARYMRGSASHGKGTPQEFIAALGSTSTRVLTLNPGEAVKF